MEKLYINHQQIAICLENNFIIKLEIVIPLLQQITLQLLHFNKEMSINYGEGTNPAELMLRVIRSCQNIEEFTKRE